MDDFYSPPNKLWKPRRKGGEFRQLFFYITSILPAILIAWNMGPLRDLVMGRRDEPAPPQVQPQLPSPEEPKGKDDNNGTGDNGDGNRSRHERDEDHDDQQRKQNDENDLATEPPPPPVVPAPITICKIDVDLTKPRQWASLQLPEGSKACTILKVNGCDESFRISPSNGQFDERKEATIIIEGPRQVGLLVSLEIKPAEGLVVLLEPRTEIDTGDQIPFTIANLKRIGNRILKEGDRAANLLAADQAEIAGIKAWLDFGGAKPLSDVHAAQARRAALTAEEAALKQKIAFLEQSVAIARDMLDLARQLDEHCVIEIGAASPEAQQALSEVQPDEPEVLNKAF